jgi:serine/threonine-protein kinase
MRCQTCNREYPDERKFCPYDGTILVKDSPPAEAPTLKAARLKVQSPGEAARRVSLTKAPFRIGKSPENDLQVRDASVNDYHAFINWRDGEYLINDAGGSSGIFVNGERVGPQGCTLKPGSIITIGVVRLTFELNIGEDTQPKPPDQPSGSQSAQTPATRICGRVDITLPSGKVVRKALVSPQTTVGFDQKNDISVDDPGVSSKHAALRFLGDRWFIYDLGSRNGTFINKHRVGPEGMRINSGDTVRMGKTRLTISITTARQFHTVAEQQFDDESARGPAAADPMNTSATTLRSDSLGEGARSQQGQPAASGRKRQPGSDLEGRYKLENVIGEGINGTVYRATRVALGDKVAVKILRSDLVNNPLAIARFRREAQVAARIHHPNSVQIYDFGTTADGEVYIVEELTSGRTLRNVLERERGLTLQRVVGIFNQICGAAHTAHLNGIVLRNITPDSIFIEKTADGKERAKVGSYGLARIESQTGDGMTMAGQAKLLGNPRYMSPEQWLDKPLDSRADVYSLGVILFELLTGEVPFDSSVPIEIAQMHLGRPAPDITSYNRLDVDEGVAAVVNRALAKEPSHRQATALQLASELRAVSGASSGVLNLVRGKASTPARAPEKAAPPPAGEEALPSAVAEAEPKGRGGLNPVVLALMSEAFLSRLSSGLIKTAVPLYALLVFGLSIPSVMALVLVQNIVPLLLRPYFGSLADKYGKKRVFMVALGIRTIVSVLYAVATLPLLFVISAIRGIADSAKGPSASAMIADHTDEKNIAQAYSWYTTVKSASGGIGEAVASFLLVIFLVALAGTQTVTANVAILNETDSSGAPKEQIVRDATEVTATPRFRWGENDFPQGNIARIEQREIRLSKVPIDDLPKVIEGSVLRKALTLIFVLATVFSALSLVLVYLFIKEKTPKHSTGDKKQTTRTDGRDHPQEAGPDVWSFALLGAVLTAPAYMVTGEFFTLLAVKLEVTPGTLGWIKIVAETVVPLVFGPYFGWLADRIGTGKVVAMRSASNIVTSLLFWVTPWFMGTALLGVFMGLARGIDEIGKAAFKPTWGAIAAKVSSFNPANRSRSMGIMEGGVDASDLTFPVLAGLLLQYASLGVLMIIRALLAVVGEIYLVFLMRKYQLLGRSSDKTRSPEESRKSMRAG